MGMSLDLRGRVHYNVLGCTRGQYVIIHCSVAIVSCAMRHVLPFSFCVCLSISEGLLIMCVHARISHGSQTPEV